MVFVVIEIQSNDETASVLTTSYSDRNQAESKYHAVLQAAAVSEVKTHSAVLMTDSGRTLKNETYSHE